MTITRNYTRKLVFTALCISLGIVLPQAFHMIPNSGSIMLPMHIPVLLCGLACGWAYGLACGMLTPFLCSVFTGMPPAIYLPSMICELAAYGLVAGLAIQHLTLKHKTLGIYAQLLSAMLAGRVVYGCMNALIFQAGAYSFHVFFTSAFITALPGIILQLVILPPILILLKKANYLS